MTEFEFLSVLVSIIFGLGLTHNLSGLFQLAFRRQLTELHALYSGWVFMVLVLNWWMFFTWRDYPGWSFDTFLLLVLWALSFYVLAIALYPPENLISGESAAGYRWFHWAVIGTIVLDVAVTAVRGRLFSPWYYLPFALHYALLAALVELVPSPALRRAVAWWFLLSVVVWALVVRRYV